MNVYKSVVKVMLKYFFVILGIYQCSWGKWWRGTSWWQSKCISKCCVSRAYAMCAG